MLCKLAKARQYKLALHHMIDLSHRFGGTVIGGNFVLRPPIVEKALRYVQKMFAICNTCYLQKW